MGDRTVLCFGDSNTYGSVPGEEGGRFAHDVRWPGVLAREFGDGWHVVEEGLPGRTTVFDDPLSAYRRGADYLPPCLASHAPLDAVVIFLGTNDLKARCAAEPSDIAEGLEVLARIALLSGSGPDGSAPRVLVLGLPRLGRVLPPDFAGAREKADALPRFVAQVAAAAAVEVLDLSAVATFSERDGIHLDAEGHSATGTAVAQRLTQMF
jgi:lysophospholipase L1-like esterase